MRAACLPLLLVLVAFVRPVPGPPLGPVPTAHFGLLPTAPPEHARPVRAQRADCPAVQNLGTLRPETEWVAEPDLAPIGRILARRDAVFRPFPGLDAGAEPTSVPIRIVLVRDLGCLERLGISAPNVDWVAGLALSDRSTVALKVERAGASVAAVGTVLRHELAHVALYRASAGRAPRWLQEGYAQLASGTWDWEQAWRLRWTFLKGSGEQLEKMQLDFPRDPERARLAYQLSYTAVQTIWELAGESGFSAFVRSLAEGNSADAAFRRVFGITEGQFTERWQQSVAGRYGILYTLSRAAVAWTGISLLLIWAAVRRRRSKREQIERLREADRREEALEREAGRREKNFRRDPGSRSEEAHGGQAAGEAAAGEAAAGEVAPGEAVGGAEDHSRTDVDGDSPNV